MIRQFCRLWTLALVAALLVTITGCPSKKSVPEASAPAVPAVPLRVAYVGSDEESRAIERAWAAISDQSLEITSLPTGAGPAQVAAVSPQNDVLIFPAQQTGTLQQREALRRLRQGLFQPDDPSEAAGLQGRLLPALERGVMRYGEETVGVPVGSVQPVLIHQSTSSVSSDLATWEAYSQQIAELPPGRSAEPLADGWAALALLNRANSYCDANWLFSGEELRPVLATAPYLRALRELQRDAKHYPSDRMTPGQVWLAACRGELDLAISWPATVEGLSTDADVTLAPLPTSREVFATNSQVWETPSAEERGEWVFLMGQEPLASLSAGCRQSSASEVFLKWLTTGEGTASMRQSVPLFTATREGTAVGDASRVSAAYADLLHAQLASNYVRPMLRIPAADQYLQALDQAVVAVLTGAKEPETALIEASEAWEEITIANDRVLQSMHWRKAQGLSR